MTNQLFSISKIFTERLFRIPDYQRGYAWGDKQLKDFWNDIVQLEQDKNHYVGVLTLEEVPRLKWKSWEDDRWIIESKSYEPFYVVDGQQRLTTTIILIQAITESLKPNQKLNYTTTDEIRKKFIFDVKEVGISRSYIFGYEKDNPSYEFLKRKIFLEDIDGYRDEETIYTLNLEKAKNFFVESISKLDVNEIEVIYKKVTQNLLFNIYTITNDIDVFVAFETMNNRGKPLSNLELLKNRLIYLSTKFDTDISERSLLRKRINDSWKAVYHYLGKNKERPLSDDIFLINHFIITFGKELEQRSDNKYSKALQYGSYKEIYDSFLLEDKFNIKNVISSSGKSTLTIEEVNNYIHSLQESVKTWYSIFNPTESRQFDDEEKYYLDKLYRLGSREYSSLVLMFYSRKPSKKLRIRFLKLLERQAFLSSLAYRYYYTIDYRGIAIQLSKGKIPKFDLVFEALEASINNIIRNSKDVLDAIEYRFKSNGFYRWEKIKYFLFEYELSLKEKSKSKRDKIDWKQYAQEHDEFITVEHIYPQNPKDPEWSLHFNFHHKRNEKLCNSLGNLLPLSRPKNSSLQNAPFLKKVDNGKDKAGYRYGSYSENEVSKFSEWTPKHILERGLHLLNFLEKRWGIDLGDDTKKKSVLGLNFLEY